MFKTTTGQSTDATATSDDNGLHAMLQRGLPEPPSALHHKQNRALVRPTTRFIQEAIAAYSRMPLEEMLCAGRGHQRATLLRQIAMYFSEQLGDDSTTKIAREFRKADHTTVMYARDKIRGMIADDPAFAKMIEELREGILRVHKEVRDRSLSDPAFRATLRFSI